MSVPNHGLPSAMPTIDLQISPGHEAARVADQEHCGASVLLRLAQLAQHILRWPVSSPLRILLEQRFDHGSDDVARRDGVDADAVLTPFGGEIAAELDHAGF